MIYIHIPFCVRKCSYCAFYSIVNESGRQAYVDALCEEIRQRADELWDTRHKVHTVYIGGGTPTVLTIEQFEQILERLHRSFNMSEVVECTIEANPENLTPQYILSLRRMGFFNRISVGIQSFDDADLCTLNRRHSGEQAREALRQAKNMGFRNVSVDLIYGIPGQTGAGWLANLDVCAEIGVQHLSCYALTVEKGTMLERQIDTGRVAMPDDSDMVSRYRLLLDWCRANGFRQYEVSNFCVGPYRSRHNSRYWNRTPYMGFGAAAHSFDGQHRRWNVPDVGRYVRQLSVGGRLRAVDYYESETLSQADAFNEYVMTALRTTDGIDTSLVDARYMEGLKRGMAKFVAAGLVDECDGVYRPTEEGLLHADGMATDLFVV